MRSSTDSRASFVDLVEVYNEAWRTSIRRCFPWVRNLEYVSFEYDQESAAVFLFNIRMERK